MILQNTTPLFQITILNCVNKNGDEMGDMYMEENSNCRKNLEMIYETKKNVDILNKEIENIKDRLDEFKLETKENMKHIDENIQDRLDEFKLETKEDMKHIDDKLELILQEKKDSYNKVKQTIISTIIGVVIPVLCVLLASGAINYIADTINK